MLNNVLVIEDGGDTEAFLELDILHRAYSITVTQDKVKGTKLAVEEEWDLIVLDVTHPGITGVEICRQVRRIKQTPIIVITAWNSLVDKINCLDSGADDYLPKPLAAEELLARIRSLLRRTGSPKDGSLLIFDDLLLDINGRALKKKNTAIDLTKREFEILQVLMKNTGRVLTREMLLETIWGYDTDVSLKVIDVYISNLRTKIDDPGTPSHVRTMRGLGYVLRN